MSKVVIFREDSSKHAEEYLARVDNNTFTSVDKPTNSNLDFETVGEAYDFAAEFPQLQYWKVGVR